MYYDYFGLKQPPFKITPDTNLFYPGCNRGAVLEALIYAILNGEGIVKVVGEVGSGKTMLCRMLEKELPENIEIVYLANPSLSPENILHAIAFELKLPVDINSSRLQVMNELHEYLLRRHSQDRQVVVFIEEAQGMPIATLEEIRLLSNLETQQSKLLQIVLFGQPELDEMIASPQIRQLKERITYSFQLMPFETDDIHEYLNSRLRACGHRAGNLFETKAVKAIERFSKGLVRRINILADKSLLAAYAENSHVIKKYHVKTAARDSEFISQRRYGRPLVVLITAALALTAAMLIYTSADRFNIPSAGSQSVAGFIEKETGKRESAGREEAINNESGGFEETGGKTSPRENTATMSIEQDNGAAATGIPVTGSGKTSEDAPLAEAVAGPADESTRDAASVDADRVELKEILNRRDPGIYTNLTESELQLLQRQLERLPPEVALLSKTSPSGDNCRVCWSMIYRPL